MRSGYCYSPSGDLKRNTYFEGWAIPLCTGADRHRRFAPDFAFPTRGGSSNMNHDSSSGKGAGIRHPGATGVFETGVPV